MVLHIIISFLLDRQSRCLVLQTSSQIAINSMISLLIHSLLPLLLLFNIWLLLEQHEYVEVFITDAMLLTVTCSWFFSRLLEFSLMSLCKNSFSSSSNARLPSSILKENRCNSSHWGMFCKKGVLLCHVSLLRTLVD